MTTYREIPWHRVDRDGTSWCCDDPLHVRPNGLPADEIVEQCANCETFIVVEVTVPEGITGRMYAAERVVENKEAQEGCDRCWCGSKYWENDRCIDCNTRFDPKMRESDVR